MPPKKASDRGGGRGRGGSSALDPSALTPDSQSDSMQTAGPSIIPPPQSTTPSQDYGNDNMDLDPNTSPATQPTETPASTPIRPPILPPSSTASGSAGGPPPKKQSKFKPKNVRRTQEELRELQEKERQRIEGLNAAAAAKARRAAAPFRRGGRGDAMGMGRGRPAITGAASGPFAQGVEEGKLDYYIISRIILIMSSS